MKYDKWNTNMEIPWIFDQLRVVQRIKNLSPFDADYFEILIINTILVDHLTLPVNVKSDYPTFM